MGEPIKYLKVEKKKENKPPTLVNEPQKETLDSGLCPISSTALNTNESWMDFQENKSPGPLSPISSTGLEMDDSAVDFNVNDLSGLELSPISSVEYENDEMSMDCRRPASILSDISSIDNLSEYQLNMNLSAYLSDISSIDAFSQYENSYKQDTLDSGLNTMSSSYLNDFNGSVNNSRHNETNNSGPITITGSDSSNRSNILETTTVEKFLMRDAFATLNAPRPACLDITAEEIAIKSRRNNDDNLNPTRTILGPVMRICDIPLPDDPHGKFSDAEFQQSKKGFCHTGEAKYIRKWPLEKIESEYKYSKALVGFPPPPVVYMQPTFNGRLPQALLGQFKKIADVERAKLINQGQIMDMELALLKEKARQIQIAKEQVDERKNRQEMDDGQGTSCSFFERRLEKTD